MKEKVNTFKTIALDTSANEILDFFKKESRRQAARDDEFLKIIGASVEQSHPAVTSPVIPPISKPRNRFRYGMTNFRPNSSMVSHQGNMPQDLSGSQMDKLFMEQMNNPNFPA